MVPLTDNSLVVDISDALSEKDKVKFTVHTRTTMQIFQKQEFLVVRQHEEFIWLHDRYEEEPKYAGYIVSLRIFCITPEHRRLSCFSRVVDSSVFYDRGKFHDGSCSTFKVTNFQE